jgi:hypothetical protein
VASKFYERMCFPRGVNPNPRKKKETFSFHERPSHRLHGNFITKISYHCFWHGLTAFSKKNLFISTSKQKPAKT